MRKIASTTAFAAALLAGVGALAADEPPMFGERHQMVLSAERLFGYTHSSLPYRSTDDLSLLGDTSTSTIAQPRVAFDVFVAGRLTAGGAAGYFRVRSSSSMFQPATTTSGVALAARVGYAAAVGRRVALWPRLGFTFVHHATESDVVFQGIPASSTTTVYALTVEVPVIVMVAPRFFVELGPTYDHGVEGHTGSLDALYPKQNDLGVQAGLGGYF